MRDPLTPAIEGNKMVLVVAPDAANAVVAAMVDIARGASIVTLASPKTHCGTGPGTARMRGEEAGSIRRRRTGMERGASLCVVACIGALRGSREAVLAARRRFVVRALPTTAH